MKPLDYFLHIFEPLCTTFRYYSPVTPSSWELSSTWEVIVIQLLKNFLAFVESDGSLSYSQEAATGLYREPDKSSPRLPFPMYRVFRAQADWTLTHTSHKDTEQSTVEASITLDGVTLTDSLINWSPNEWPSVCREIPQCLPIRCSGRLISLHNEHPV
jgi:hypothetical protein